MQSKFLNFSIFCCLIVLISCNEDTNDIIGDPEIINIVVDKSTLARGEQFELAAEVRDGNGNLLESQVTWSTSDPITIEIDQTGKITGIRPGTAIITAEAEGLKNTLTVTVSEELTSWLKDYIEALFLGTGPFIPRDGFTACVNNTGIWAAFPRNTTVTIIASNTLDQASDGNDTKQFIQDALVVISDITNGWLNTGFEVVDDPDPIPNENEITTTDHPDPQSTGCQFDRGCTHLNFTDNSSTILRSARVTQKEDVQPADAFVHDVIGHGLLGMCHIDQQIIGGNAVSLMAGGPGAFTGEIPDQLSPLDLAAVNAVYSATLNPGANRSDFIQEGLINQN